MLKEAIYHKIDSEYVYAVSKKDMLIKLRTKKNDVKEVNLYYKDKYLNQEYNKAAMKKITTDEFFDYYEAIIEFDVISLQYLFELKDEETTLYYANYVFREVMPKESQFCFVMPTISRKDTFVVPEWAKESIVYQIFPERFCNGDKTNDPENVKPWDSEVDTKIMLGGDLQGIIDKLDYILEVGFNTIYLTPVFYGGSNHKYSTFDYYKIDPDFGTNEKLKELVQEAHKRNIRVILDAVFNHSNPTFFAFKDVLENGEKSKYKDWYHIKKFPVVEEKNPNYKTFGYVPEMPKLNMSNDDCAKYFIDVATYWIKEADIDGWRLDVADEIDHYFWKKFRKAVKEVKEDALIVGEVWYDSRAWLMGDEFDSVMNYMFRNAIEGFISNEELTAQGFGERLGEIRGIYKVQAYNNLWNLIGSHDTARFLHTCDENTDKQKIAALMQFTFTGTPMVYYGDEVGMTGGPDPDCRRGMIWDEEKQNKDMLEYYKKLIKIRKEHRALQHGDFKTIHTNDEKNTYGFNKEYNGESLDVFINNSYECESIEVPSEGKIVDDILNDREFEVKDGKINIFLAPKSGAILKIRK